MTCNGPGVCNDADVVMSYTKGTFICKGGTSGSPACFDMEIDAGCLFCDGENSCGLDLEFWDSFKTGTRLDNNFKRYIG